MIFMPPSPKSCSQFILTWDLGPGRRMKDALRMMEWGGRGEGRTLSFQSQLCNDNTQNICQYFNTGTKYLIMYLIFEGR